PFLGSRSRRPARGILHCRSMMWTEADACSGARRLINAVTLGRASAWYLTERGPSKDPRAARVDAGVGAAVPSGQSSSEPFDLLRRHTMARTAIQPPDMADPRPRYTHGWRVGNTVYVAGQLALDKDGKLVGPNDIGAQTRRVLENMRRILEAGGASLRDVVKVTVFVTDIRYREGYGEVRQEVFVPHPPPRTPRQIFCLSPPRAP